MYPAQSNGYYFYGPQWHNSNLQEGPKIVELEPSELGGARSDLSGFRRYDVLSLPRNSNLNENLNGTGTGVGVNAGSGAGTRNGHRNYNAINGNGKFTIENRHRKGLPRTYNLDETMNNRQAKTRSWKEVNDDVSARMIAASSDSPPIIPKRDYDHSPDPSLPRPTRSVASSAIGKRNAVDRDEENRGRSEQYWEDEMQNNRPGSFVENGHQQGGQLVLYSGGTGSHPPPPPPPMMPFPGGPPPENFFPPPLLPGPMALAPFGQPFMGPPLIPPPDLYGFGPMPFGGPPPVFMDGPFPPPPGMIPMDPETGPMYGAPPPPPMGMGMPFLPPPMMPPIHPMDFEMFTWAQQKSKKGKKSKRSKSMEYLIPPPPPPPGPWMMPPPMMSVPPPPPFMDETAAMYGMFPPGPPPPPPPPRPLALPPTSNFIQPISELKKEPINGEKQQNSGKAASTKKDEKNCTEKRKIDLLLALL